MTEEKLKLAVVRSEALFNFYSAERRAGVDVLTAHERMAEFAKRLDAMEYERDLNVLRQTIQRT